MSVRVLRSAYAVFFALLGLMAASAHAQSKLSNAQLDQLTASVALYPDALLSQVLMASTYPADVAAASTWSAGHTSLSGDAAVKAVDAESWDPSVKSLAAFPSVLDMMGRQPQWVQSLGDAFLAQPDDVMDSVQRLRAQAKQAGSLTTNKQQTVTTQATGTTTVVKIEPTNPQVVYVPTYDPAVVYGTWSYPTYPPYYYPPPPGSVFATSLVAGIGFGLGVAAADSMWGGFDWGHGDVDIDVNRYNNINVHNRIDHNGNNVKWQHNGANRGAVPYRDANVRDRHEAQRQMGLSNRTGGQSREAARERASQSFERSTGHAIAGHDTAGRRASGGAGQRHADFQGNAQRPNHTPSAVQRQHQDQFEARNRARDANQLSAFHGAGDGQRMHQQIQRGSFAQAHVGGGLGGGRAGGFHGLGRR